MKIKLETLLGIFFALAFLAGVAIVEMVGGTDWFRGGYRLYADFAGIHELRVGDPVRMAGVQVGKVSDITLATNMVRVTLRMDRAARARTDSRASIKSPSILGGQNYVAIDFGTNGPPAEEGMVLATVEQPDMDQIMVKLDHVATGVENLTKTFSGDKLSNLLGPLTDLVSQNSAHIGAIFTNAENITAQVASGRGTVGKLIYQDELYTSAVTTVTNFQATADEIKKAVADARAILAQVNAGQGTAGRLVKDDKLYNEATASMTHLKEILQKINGGQGTVGQLVNDDTMLKNVKVSLQKLDKATEGLEDTGPLTVLGAAVGKLF